MLRILSSNKLYIAMRFLTEVPTPCTRKSEGVIYLYSGAKIKNRQPRKKNIWLPTRTYEIEPGRILHSAQKLVLLTGPGPHHHTGREVELWRANRTKTDRLSHAVAYARGLPCVKGVAVVKQDLLPDD